MTRNLSEIKAELLQKAKKQPETFYPVDSLQELGFQRKDCEHCGKLFWVIGERDYCDEPECRLKSGQLPYGFIDNPPSKKRLDYTETWKKAWVPVFEEHGHTVIPRYPIVARWRDDTEFVQASVYGFQPLVVSGEVDPPANPILIPQPCLRFNDIDNVGLSGRHFTSFVMVGQLVFNNPNKFIYFMEEGIKYIHEYLTSGLGVDPREIVYHADSWGGGGNLGSSLEFFIRGLEVGNQVYMTYKLTPEGNYEKLSTTVIDMGAGLGRSTWLINGFPTQYEANFGSIIPKVLNEVGISPDKKFWKKYGQYSGVLNYTETDVSRVFVEVSKLLAMDPLDLKEKIQPMKDVYSLIDHTRSLLWAISDGALPSNVGGGYNLRFLIRRAWSIINENDWDIELFDVVKWHMDELAELFPDYTKHAETVREVLELEYERYRTTRAKGRKILKKKLSKQKELSTEELIELYDSKGIVPEMVVKVAEELGKNIRIPSDFYSKLADIHEKSEQDQKLKTQAEIVIPEDLPDTEIDYDQMIFDGEIIWKKDNLVVLKKTGFYPTSGGQMHDLGSIDGIEIKEVRKVGGVIVHVLKKPLLGKKKTVHCVVDPHRRQILMQHHTATHVVNAAAREILGDHIWQAGAEKTIKKARLDITHYDSLSREELAAIEKRANEIVYSNIPVTKTELPRDIAEKRYGFTIYQGGAVPGKTLRIVAIDDIDIECCGGTHVNRTGDIGPIIMLGSERIQDGIVRLEYVSGEQAVKEIQKRDKLVQQTLDMWGIDLESLPDTAERFFNEWKSFRKEISELKQDKAELRAKLFQEKSEKLDDINVIAEQLSGDSEYLTDLAFALTKKKENSIVLLISKTELFTIITVSPNLQKEFPANELIKPITNEMNGGGGGKPDFARGSGKDEEKISSAIELFYQLLQERIEKRKKKK